jgi:hypothetical protein
MYTNTTDRLEEEEKLCEKEIQENIRKISATQRRVAQRNATQCSATHCNATQRNATQRSATQRSATQCSATQRDVAQCNHERIREKKRRRVGEKK